MKGKYGQIPGNLLWLYTQGEQAATLSKISLGVLVGFPATAVMLIIIYIALQHSFQLYS